MQIIFIIESTEHTTVHVSYVFQVKNESCTPVYIKDSNLTIT